jgi:hypothetical protein
MSTKRTLRLLFLLIAFFTSSAHSTIIQGEFSATFDFLSTYVDRDNLLGWGVRPPNGTVLSGIFTVDTDLAPKDSAPDDPTEGVYETSQATPGNTDWLNVRLCVGGSAALGCHFGTWVDSVIAPLGTGLFSSEYESVTVRNQYGPSGRDGYAIYEEKAAGLEINPDDNTQARRFEMRTQLSLQTLFGFVAFDSLEAGTSFYFYEPGRPTNDFRLLEFVYEDVMYESAPGPVFNYFRVASTDIIKLQVQLDTFIAKVVGVPEPSLLSLFTLGLVPMGLIGYLSFRGRMKSEKARV